MRIEADSLGSMAVPDEAYYGIHTQRARTNFPVTTHGNDATLIKNYLLIKEAAAQANMAAGRWPNPTVPKAIIAACRDLRANFEKYASEFFLPAIQGGAGTSTNMNVNEVVANRALELLGKAKGDYAVVNPNDDVNKSQSTNDTYPTAGHLTMIDYSQALVAQLQVTIKELHRLAERYATTLKMGRTQLEDAVPTTVGRSFHAYAQMFQRDVTRINQAATTLHTLPLGGTAIGTGLTATPEYISSVVPYLSELTDKPLRQAPDLIDAVQNNDCYVELANAYKALAVNLSKFSNDLRLLNSGPQAGLHELDLPKRQAGSSIMPGKVNPVIPEVCNQVAFQVIGHATTVTLAAEAGQLELNAFEPVAFYDLFADAKMLRRALQTLTDNCLKDIKVNAPRCAAMVEHSAEVATVLSPYLGYAATSAIVKQSLATQRPLRDLVAGKITADQFAKLMAPKSFFVTTDVLGTPND